MKTANIFKAISGLAISALTLLASSCAEVEYPEHSANCELQKIQMNVRVPQPDKTKLVYQAVEGKIDHAAGKVTFDVPYNLSDDMDEVSDISKVYLIGSLPISAIVTPALGGLKDMTQPMDITVTAANGATKDYTLEARLKKSSAAEITAFSFTIGETTFTGISNPETHIVNYLVPTPDLFDVIAATPAVPTITVSPRATILTDISKPMDFSKDVKIQVKAQDGTVVDWTIFQTEPVMLDYGFGYVKKQYTRTADELGFAGTLDVRGMAVTKNYLVIHDRNFKFKLCDKATGEIVGEAAYPGDLDGSTSKAASMYIDKDAEGNLVAGSFTSWTTGAKFVLYYYGDGETNAPKRILEVPGLGDCGRKFTVAGSLKTGTGFVYATKGKGNLVHRFRFVDGVYQDHVSITISAPNANFTYMCTPVALGNTIDSEFILVDQQATGFGCINKYGADGSLLASMADGAKCRESGTTLDGRVFSFNSATYFLTIDANSNSTAGRIRIYDITSADSFTMAATHPEFGKFLVFMGEDLASTTNGNGTAAVAYDIAEDGETCDVYMMLTNGGVMKYQLTKIAL